MHFRLADAKQIPLGIFVSETVVLVRQAGFGKAVTIDEGIDCAFYGCY